MIEFFFISLVVSYVLVSSKVDEWITISALGVKSETPLMFLKKPRFYDVVRSALFIVAAILVFAMEDIPWFMAAVVLAGAWLAAGWRGRKKAFSKYRHILRDMAQRAETPQEKTQYEAESKKDDQQLMSIVQTSMKLGI